MDKIYTVIPICLKTLTAYSLNLVSLREEFSAGAHALNSGVLYIVTPLI